VVARLIAGGLCGFAMSVWASAVGILVGWRLASALIGVSTHVFFSMLFDMLWVRDVLGLLIKGSAFGLVAAWLACQEGLRLKDEPSEFDRLVSTSTAAWRSASFSMLAILLISGAWFLLLYHAGLPFGPTLLKPPNS
jgi:phospholipid/cholesterol/gamma-HCH transport system permease protein